MHRKPLLTFLDLLGLCSPRYLGMQQRTAQTAAAASATIDDGAGSLFRNAPTSRRWSTYKSETKTTMPKSFAGLRSWFPFLQRPVVQSSPSTPALAESGRHDVQETEQERWDAAEVWVTGQLEAMRRHRVIMKRLSSTLGHIKPVHPGDVLLEIELPSTLVSDTRTSRTSRWLRPMLMCSASVPESPSSSSSEGNGSETSFEGMVRQVRGHIARFNAMQDAESSEQQARLWSTTGVTRAYRRARESEERRQKKTQ